MMGTLIPLDIALEISLRIRFNFYHGLPYRNFSINLISKILLAILSETLPRITSKNPSVIPTANQNFRIHSSRCPLAILSGMLIENPSRVQKFLVHIFFYV